MKKSNIFVLHLYVFKQNFCYKTKTNVFVYISFILKIAFRSKYLFYQKFIPYFIIKKIVSNLSLRSSDAISPCKSLHVFCDSENVPLLSVITYSLILHSVKKNLLFKHIKNYSVLFTTKIKSLPKIHKLKAVFYDCFDLKLLFIITTV